MVGQCRLLGFIDPHAVRQAQPRRRQAELGEVARCSPAPVRARRARPRRDSPRHGCARAGRARARAPPPLRAARASTTRRSGARTRRAAAVRAGHASGAWSARLSSIERATCSSSRRDGRVASASIMHLPTTARRPIGSSASKTASVSCTVSIVSTVVVPPSSSSAAASRADAASDAGVCAASIGQMRRFSQSSSARSSA